MAGAVTTADGVRGGHARRWTVQDLPVVKLAAHYGPEPRLRSLFRSSERGADAPNVIRRAAGSKSIERWSGGSSRAA